MIKCKQALPHIVEHMRQTIKDNDLLGLAANQIGADFRIIIANDVVMYNPYIIHGYGEMTTIEGCLDVEGLHRVTRFGFIVVAYMDELFRDPQIVRLIDNEAGVVQHEIDHLDGITIDKH
jgi:peptide deformylase